MDTTAIAIVFAIALILTLLSTWRVSPFFYYAILVLYAVGLVLDLVGVYRASGRWDWQAAVLDALFYGFIFYYVTMQKLMGRKVYEIAAVDALRAHLLERNSYHAWHKALVYLPAVLIVGGIIWAIYWKFFA